MWAKYFEASKPGPDGGRWFANGWLGALPVAFLLATAFAVYLSAVLLRHWGIWTSPVPIAVGMLLEGSVLGVVKHVHSPYQATAHWRFVDHVHHFFYGRMATLMKHTRVGGLLRFAVVVVWVTVLLFALFIH